MNNHNPKVETCALCKQKKELRDSHIIPEFLYKFLYDLNHKYTRLSTKRKPKRSFEQKGIREKLLCDNCERQFSKYESYAKGVLSKIETVQKQTSDSKRFEVKVDYTKFKLFELSIVWRVGVSSVPDFKDIVLGSHKRRLRKMLREEIPGSTEQYGCMLLWPVSNRDILDELIKSMGMWKIRGVQCCKLVFAGMCWLFFLSKKIDDERQKGLFLQSDGSLRILGSDKGMDVYLKKLAKDLYTNNPHIFGQS